jgi:hypothetical protein
LVGLLYAAIVIRRARRQTVYQPVLEDWMFHAALPTLAYALVTGGAVALLSYTTDALFTIAAATLLLVFIGIHNAWDTVTFITLGQLETPSDSASSATLGASSDGTPAATAEATRAEAQ